jgi:hypothetical protein
LHPDTFLKVFLDSASHNKFEELCYSCVW